MSLSVLGLKWVVICPSKIEFSVWSIVNHVLIGSLFIRNISKIWFNYKGCFKGNYTGLLTQKIKNIERLDKMQVSYRKFLLFLRSHHNCLMFYYIDILIYQYQQDTNFTYFWTIPWQQQHMGKSQNRCRFSPHDIKKKNPSSTFSSGETFRYMS